MLVKRRALIACRPCRNGCAPRVLVSTLAIVVVTTFAASSSAEAATWNCREHASSSAAAPSSACEHEGHGVHSSSRMEFGGLAFGVVVAILTVGGAKAFRTRCAGLRDRLCSSLLFRPPRLAG